MFEMVYYELLADVKSGNTDSVIFKHHIQTIDSISARYSSIDYLKEEPNQIVVDYIASMTDDYFIDLFRYLFPDSKYSVDYISYFE